MNHKEDILFEDDHFLIHGFQLYFPKYLGLWAVAITIAIAAYFFCPFDVDYSITRMFAMSITTLSMICITFAIPTCLGNISSVYKEYYSTPITRIIISTFPITLLVFSAFTSLIVSMLVTSGFLGNYVPLSLPSVMTLLVFWGGVCIFYLVIVISRLVDFLVNAPGAILNKLEFGVFNAKDLNNQEEYNEFRQKLASINDIASTIVSKSTGRDSVILRCLYVLVDIHKTYLEMAIEEEDKAKRKRYFKACRAVSQEMIRIYREAVSSKNEKATKNILTTYCKMIASAVNLDADYLYITEMISQIDRYQSYAYPSNIEVIQEQAATDWFFYLANELKNCDAELDYAKICIIRELSFSLRKITIDDKDNLMNRFMRVASNSDIEIELDNYSDEWLAMLDRAILIYMAWLYKSLPSDVEKYFDYLATYSSEYNNRTRSVICDTPGRFYKVIGLARLSMTFLEDENGNKQTTKGNDASNPRISYGTNVVMGMNAEMDINKALAYATMMEYCGLNKGDIKASSTAIAEQIANKLDEIAKDEELAKTEDFQKRLECAKIATGKSELKALSTW